MIHCNIERKHLDDLAYKFLEYPVGIHTINGIDFIITGDSAVKELDFVEYDGIQIMPIGITGNEALFCYDPDMYVSWEEALIILTLVAA